MTLEEIRDYCLAKPGVAESIKWENHLCFVVGEKMFLVTAPDHVPVSASFKTSDELFDALSAKEGIIPAPYMARNKWVQLDDIRRLSDKDWKKYIDLSYALIASKLPAKLRREIGESSAPTTLPAKKKAAKKAAKKTASKVAVVKKGKGK